MVRHAVKCVAAAALAVTAFVPDRGVADGVEHHVRHHVARSHVCRPVVERWDPVTGPWPRIAYVGAAFAGPATGAITRLHCGYWPECIRYPHHQLHCTYPF